MNKNIILIFAGILLVLTGLNAQSENTLLAQQSNNTSNTSVAKPQADTALANQLMQRANYLYNANRFDSLAILANQASDIYQRKNDWAAYLDAQLMMVTDLYLNSELDSAQVISSQILQESRERLGDQHFVTAKAYMQQGILALANIKPKVALDYFTIAHNILANAPGQTTTIARLYSLIAYIHQNYNSDPVKALNYCEAALTISKNKLDSSDGVLGGVYADVGVLYADLEKYDRALNTFDDALKIYYRSYSDNLMGVAALHYNIGLVKSKQEQFEQAVESFEKALELILLTTGGENQLTVKLYSKIGQIYMGQLGNRVEAMPYMKKAITTAKKVNAVADPAIEYRYRILGKYYIE